MWWFTFGVEIDDDSISWNILNVKVSPLVVHFESDIVEEWWMEDPIE